MKLSEAIAELEKAIKEHGDIELFGEYAGLNEPSRELYVGESNSGNVVAIF